MKKARQRAGIDGSIMRGQPAIDLRGPPSSSGFQRLRELTDRMHEGTDIETPQQHLQKIEALKQAAARAYFNDPREQRKRQAAVVRREQRRQRAAIIEGEVKALAAKLKRSGARNPVERAEEIVAKQHGFPSPVALNRWVRRNR